MTDLPTAILLDTKVHGPTLEQALGRIEDWIAEPAGSCRFVVVTGFHGLWEGEKDPAFRALLNTADLFCPDGIAAVALARLKGHSFPGRVTGGELMRGMLERSAAKGYRSFFYGDTDDTLARLRDKLPPEVVAGTFSPPFRPLDLGEEAAYIDMINASGADIVWVGLGCPRQEAWIARNRDRLTAKVALGVGAVFRFEAGLTRRAPQWLGDAGLEWVWRFVAEPKKLWKRDLLDGPRFIVAAARDVLRSRELAKSSGEVDIMRRE